MYIYTHVPLSSILSQSSSIYIVELSIWINDLTFQECHKLSSNVYELAMFQRSCIDARNLSLGRLNSCIYKLISMK